MKKALLFTSGLGLGAGLMFLLDPEGGANRRRQARSQLQNYRHYTDDFLEQSGRRMGSQARHLWANVRPSMTSLVDSPRALWQDRLAPQPSSSLSSMFLLGSALVGLGLLYYLDPENGSQRRTTLRDNAQKYWQKQQKKMSQTAESIGQRSREMLEGARSHLHPSATPGNQAMAEQTPD